MNILKFVVRWEMNGEEQSKEYDDEPTAKKAKAWLIERGATNIDIAVRPIKVSSPFPVRSK